MFEQQVVRCPGKNSQRNPLDAVDNSKHGHWGRKDRESAAKAGQNVIDKRERALANAARRELQSHNEAIKALAATAQEKADALKDLLFQQK
jgi:hypothetical protein